VASESRHYRETLHCGGNPAPRDTRPARLNLSVKTVSTRNARLIEKMGLGNQTELIHHAIRHQLVDDSDTPA